MSVAKLIALVAHTLIDALVNVQEVLSVSMRLTQLHRAAQKGDLTEVTLLLKKVGMRMTRATHQCIGELQLT